MQLASKVVVVTGGANGIGRALCRRFALEGARAVVVADIQEAAAQTVADEIGGIAIQADVSRETDVRRLVQRVIEDHGVIDLFCSNAGVGVSGGVEASDEDWKRSWDANLMAHHHLVCTECGRVTDVVEPQLAAAARPAAAVAARHGFAMAGHAIEIFGRCAACRAARRSQSTPAQGEAGTWLRRRAPRW